MTLKEKLHKIYASIDMIEKRGYNEKQRYNHILAADVTNAIRKQLREQGVYAEINFDFVGAPYTISRATAPDAPFTAVNVRCSIVFHDLTTMETLTSSGLGSGADMGDKAAYKAQTGALKYTLKNAFLVPDEADPEADESVDEGSYRRPPTNEMPGVPAFTRPPSVPRGQNRAERPAAAWKPQLLPPPEAVPTEKQNVGAAIRPEGLETPFMREPGDDDPGLVPATTPEGFANELDAESSRQADPRPPTEEELTDYRSRFTKLSDELADKKYLEPANKIPVNRQVLLFLLDITKVTDAKFITKAQWDDFFARVDKIKSYENGLVGLAKKINKTNGIEEKQK